MEAEARQYNSSRERGEGSCVKGTEMAAVVVGGRGCYKEHTEGNQHLKRGRDSHTQKCREGRREGMEKGNPCKHRRPRYIELGKWEGGRVCC